MPEWFINAVATGGPATALIMTYMWWRAEKRAEKYETLWIAANQKLPGQIMEFTDQHRKAYRMLAKAIWAQLRALHGGGSLPPIPMSADDDGGD